MKKIYAIFFLIPLILLIILAIPICSPTKPIEIERNQLAIKAKIYNINGHSQLESSSSSGNGTYDDPYIIKDLIVNAPLSTDFAIYIENTNDYFILINCTASGGSQAITLDNVLNGRIENCTVRNSDYGISVMNSNNCTVFNNTAFNINSIGIDLYSSDEINVLNNLIYAGITGWYGIRSTLSSHFANLSLNNIRDYATGIYIDGPHNNTVLGNTISDTSDGIALHSSDNTSIFGNEITMSEWGIYIESSSTNNRIVSNNASSNMWGLYVEWADQNTFINNTMNYNDYDGFTAVSSNFLNLTLNKANHNGEKGFYIKYCLGMNFTLNEAINNNETGVYLEDCDYSTFTNNTINRNLQYGIFINLYCNYITIKWNILWYNMLAIYRESYCSCIIIQNNDIKSVITLTDGEVTPLEGDDSTVFIYTVTYTNVDDRAPISIQVIIDLVPHEMYKLNSSDDVYTDGCIYTFNITFSSGSHTYAFEASDGVNVGRDPDSGYHQGPSITKPIPGFTNILLIFMIIAIFSLLTKIQPLKKDK